MADIKNKRKQIEKLVLDTMILIDKTGINSDHYKEFFKKMNDAEFTKWITTFLKDKDANFYMEFLPHKNEPILEDLEKAGKYLNVPLDEYVYMRQDGNDKDPIRTPYKVPVGYVCMKRLQQMLTKKNSYSINTDMRNEKTGQLTGDDKVARITEAEAYDLAALGADGILHELYGFRADDSVNRTKLYQQIALQGYCSMDGIESESKNKAALNNIDVFLIGSGMKSDLITDGLALQRTLELRSVRKSQADKAGRVD